jgi:hypothetical protein
MCAMIGTSDRDKILPTITTRCNFIFYIMMFDSEIRMCYCQELLFRGALLPLIAPDWRGVAISGIVFGTLHLSGGRNSAFALW